MKPLITPEQLKLIGTTIIKTELSRISKALNDICPEYGIINSDIFHEFIANLMEECQEFYTFEENLNYKTDTLINTFGRHRISIVDANKFGRKPGQQANKSAIANIVYGGKWGKINLGNTNAGDGWLFRGSGAIQLTGRNNVTLFTKYFNEKFDTCHLPEEMVLLLRTNLEYSIHSACWFFAIAKNLIKLAIDDNMREVIKRINGGLNGFEGRMKYYEKAKKYIK